MPLGFDPKDALDSAQPLLAIGAGGLLGRLMYRAKMHPRRPFFSWDILFELPIALGMGIIAHGGCEAAVALGLVDELPELARTAVVVFVSYLGPRAVDALFELGLGRLGGLLDRLASKPK